MAETASAEPSASSAAHELRKRSVTLAGHRTSLSLENAFWSELKRAAAAEGSSLNGLITRIDAARSGNLSSAVRVFVVERLRSRLATLESDSLGGTAP